MHEYHNTPEQKAKRTNRSKRQNIGNLLKTAFKPKQAVHQLIKSLRL